MMRKELIPVIVMMVILACTSAFFRHCIKVVDSDPVYQEVCVYPVSPEHGCCPEHFELHREKENRIDRLWSLGFFMTMVGSMLQAEFIAHYVRSARGKFDEDKDII